MQQLIPSLNDEAINAIPIQLVEQLLKSLIMSQIDHRDGQIIEGGT